MRSLLRLSILLAVILLLIACETIENPGEKEYKVIHWPDVMTLGIKDITDTSATLTAAVNSFNLPTTVSFEYGITTSYGNTVTADQSPVKGIAYVSANISGLSPCTRYHFRVKAENSIWKNFYSSDKTFVLPVPPLLTGLPDTPILNATNYNNENSGLPGNFIMGLAVDKSNNIWIASSYMDADYTGTFLAGVSKFDGTNWTNHTTADGLTGEVTTIAIDAQDNKWFGIYGRGVLKFDGINWTTYMNPNSTASNFVNSIVIDAQGNKWFATHNGVSKFDGTNWTDYIWNGILPPAAGGLLGRHVVAIAIDGQDNKWFGTEFGVTKFNGYSWTYYTTANGQEIGLVCEIAMDSEGSKWLGTYGRGVFKISGRN